MLTSKKEPYAFIWRLTYSLISCLLLFSFLQNTAYAKEILTPYQSIHASGARALVPMKLDGKNYLAVAQLAKDVPGVPGSFVTGNYDVDILIYKWKKGVYKLYQSIPSHGNETLDFFRVGNRDFLAVPSVQSGQAPHLNLHTYSKLYEWDGKRFYPVQQFPAFASKSFFSFMIKKNHYLAQSNGVVLPNQDKSIDTSSFLYQWNGQKYKRIQTFPTKWGYGMAFFTIKNSHYFALADHLSASVLYKWDDNQFIPFQSFSKNGGRGFSYFNLNSQHYLAFANLLNNSELYRWNGKKFVVFQTFPGKGGRNFTFFVNQGKYYLFLIKHTTGPREKPEVVHDALLYQWTKDKFKLVQKIKTYGGVDAETWTIDGQQYLSVANSIDAKYRRKVDSVIYKVNDVK